jgi:hypothetical protein
MSEMQTETGDEPKWNAEDYFPPRHGGLVHTARMEAEKLEKQLADYIEGKPEQKPKQKPVPTKAQEPDKYGARTVVVSTGSNSMSAMVLPADPSRQRAVILAVDEPIVVAVGRSMADNAAAAAMGQPLSGFFLPVGLPFEVKGGGEVWVGATSATAGRVSSWSESYGC